MSLDFGNRKPIKEKLRNSTFDMMKGLAIILMVIGHRVDTGTHIIYSFHMPLFFIIAGFFFHPKSLKKSFISDIRRLLVPYFLIGTLTIVAMMTIENKMSLKGIIEGFKCLIWAKAYRHASPIWGDEIYHIGAIWFLFALFWTKNLFNILFKFCHNLYILGIYSFIIALSAVLVDRYIICPPFALFPGMSALIFYYVGFLFHKLDVFEKVRNRRWSLYVCLAVWILGIILGTINIGTCYYKQPVFAITGAIAACIFWYCIFNKIKVPILIYFGVVSLSVLCVHKLITAFHIYEILNISYGWVQVLFDIIACVVLIPLMQRFRILREIFGLPELSIKNYCK